MHRVVALADVAGSVCLASRGFAEPADAGAARHRLVVHPPLGGGVRAGAPVRFTRRVRYALYRGADRAWYLGHDQLGGGSWAGVQPVSGPVLPADSPEGERGLELRWLDADGREVSDPADVSRVARVDIVLRAGTRAPVRLLDDSARVYRDSLVTSVAIRNRP
jgi:hypothetical protein